MMDWGLLVLGGVLLYFGAEYFVGGASALAASLRVPQLIVGLTVVAYGTSAPEIIVGINSAYNGHGDVALGNVIGSNIANIGLILGVAALLSPARVDGALRVRELPMLIISTALVPLTLIDGVVSRLEGSLLLLGAVGYSAIMVRSARLSSLREARREAEVTAAAADAAGAPTPAGPMRSVVTALVGLCVLLLGGHLFVNASVNVAESLGMSERLVGLTIVAIGTSLPELVTSIVAARRGASDIAVGNVIGSNIFNVFLCLGAASATAPLVSSLAGLAVDLAAMVVMTVLAVIFIRTERVITRLEGGIALALYALYMVVTVVRG